MTKPSLKTLLLFFLSSFLLRTAMGQDVQGTLQKWHKITLNFDGPSTSETDVNNPFLNYRLNVTFTHTASGKSYQIPGYYAADGDAGNTGASSGDRWRVHFAADEVGEWRYEVDFRQGKWAALRHWDRLETGGYMDGLSGTLSIAPTDKTGDDFRARGRLQYVGQRYLRFAETGEYFLKCGSDAPENFLSYEDFDGTFKTDGRKDELVKKWEAHLQDWNDGDPTWGDGKGKAIIGAINYLADKGLNAFSFLTMNIAGDDQNVFPYIDYGTWDRIDCSKLDQWEVVFEHADKLGLFLHFKTLEDENQGLLDNGGLGLYTKLYYRELIARFGHHLALNWNLAEESGDWHKDPRTLPLTDDDRLLLAKYVSQVDPYDHHLVIHNGVWYDGLYGPDSPFTGASLQTNKTDFSRVHDQLLRILKDSEAAGKVWAVACDEPGDHRHSLLPDAEDPDHDDARKNGLWGAMMAGGWGTEWYFGYEHAHSDLTCQDYRSRDLFWDQGRICLEFFRNNDVPYWRMESADDLLAGDGYVLAEDGWSYVVYLKEAGEAQLDLGEKEATYDIRWYNPRAGGALQTGSLETIRGTGEQSLGAPPADPSKDWVVWITRK